MDRAEPGKIRAVNQVVRRLPVDRHDGSQLGASATTTTTSSSATSVPPMAASPVRPAAALLPPFLRVPDVPFDLVPGPQPVLLDQPVGDMHVAGCGEKGFRPAANESRSAVGDFEDTK
jgi:hypothetical protein